MSSQSAAMAKGVPLSDILARSRDSTFKRFYYCPSTTDEFAKLLS